MTARSSRGGVACNGSRCGRAGTRLAAVPPEKLEREQGGAHLTSDRFDEQVAEHRLCRTCGIEPFARGKGPRGERIAVNVRWLDDVDVFALATNAEQHDGKKL